MDSLPFIAPSGPRWPNAPEVVTMEMTSPVARAGSRAEWQEAKRKAGTESGE